MLKRCSGKSIRMISARKSIYQPEVFLETWIRYPKMTRCFWLLQKKRQRRLMGIMKYYCLKGIEIFSYSTIRAKPAEECSSCEKLILIAPWCQVTEKCFKVPLMGRSQSCWWSSRPGDVFTCFWWELLSWML